MAHTHPVYDTDKHFIIDPLTKKITTECQKLALPQHSHKSERLTFEIPKEVEGHDMSTCNVVEIHFQNIDAANKNNKRIGICKADDLKTEGDTVYGSWLIDGEATHYAGGLIFAIHFSCVENDKVEYNLPTLSYSGITIGATVWNSETIANEHPDIIAEFEARIHVLEQGGASDEQIAQAVNKYLQENPVHPGATNEQAAQIQQNKEDIEKLVTDKVDNDQLLNAVNDALEEAKASGEFKGEPGAPGKKGDPGDDYILTEADKQEIAEMVEVPEGGTVTDEQIAEALENYLKDNPITSGSSIFYSSLSFEYNAGSILSFFQCDKQEIRKNGRNVQVGDLIIFGNLSLGIVEKVTDTQVSGSLYASLKGEPGSGGGGLDATIDGETLVFAESSTATIENETLIL